MSDRPIRDPAFHAALEDAVARAEEETAAELVVVLAEQSGDYADVHLRNGAALAAALLVFMLYAPIRVPEWLSLLNLAAVFAGGMALSRFWSPVRRLWTCAERRAEQTDDAAQQVFAEESVHATVERNGVLVYWSAFERQARLVADLGIRGRLEAGQLHFLERQLDEAEDLRSTLPGVIERLGALLAVPFPKTAGDADEISNRPRLRS